MMAPRSAPSPAGRPVSDTSSFLRDNPFGHSEFLVGKAKGGSQRAWDAIYLRYRKMLLTHVQARLPLEVRRRVDAEDVLQKAMARAWQSIDQFQYQGENSFRHWLRRLVVNTALNEVQAQQPELRRLGEAGEPLDELHGPEQREETRAREAKSDLLEALGTLDELDRDLVIQRNFEELSFDQMAAILECSRDTARLRYGLAFDRLQQRLKR